MTGCKAFGACAGAATLLLAGFAGGAEARAQAAAHQPDVHRALAGRPYAETVAVSARLAESLSRRLDIRIEPHGLLIDAPPAEREVEFRLTIRDRVRDASGSTGICWRGLEALSPVVRSLAHEQFDDLVKRVRLFAPEPVAAAIANAAGLEDMILEAC